MFDFFKKKDPDEGVLSNLKTITKWVKELPAGDIYSAQEKVVQNLIQFNHAETNFSKDRLQVLMHLDEETRDMQSSLCAQYLRNARMSKSIESRLWVAIHAFYWEITRSYHAFLMDFVANPGGSKIQTQIPLITARAIRGFADIIKWRYFRYEQPDEKLWLRLHNLYRIAEFDNFGNTDVLVYRSDNNRHTPAQEYGGALLLSLFGNGTLAPKDIEMVAQWLNNWNTQIHIDTLYSPGSHTFYVDTSKGTGLRRCRNQVSDPTLRFMSTDELLKTIERVTAAVKTGTTPASLGLTEEFRLPEGFNLLTLVEREWAPLDARDRRTSERVPQSGQWKVMHGLAQIGGQLAKTGNQGMGAGHTQLSPEEILDIKLYGFVTERTKARERQIDATNKPRHDVWDQADSSDKGLGFVAPPATNDWVKVGRMIALSPIEEEDWALGVVTRIARKGDKDRHIGVKLLEGVAQAISLRIDGSDRLGGYVVDDPDQAPDSQTIKAILLTDDDNQETLLIDGANYARDRQYTVLSPFGESRVIQLMSVADSGESWLKVEIKTVAV